MRKVIIGLLALLAAQASVISAPSLDGFVNEPFWAEKGRGWTLHDPAQPGTVARCMLAYDDLYLYFAADVIDANVVGSNRTPKSKVWEDDAIKLLLHVGDPAAEHWTAETFSYTFSAMGGVNWTRGPLPASPDPSIEPGWPAAWNSALNWAVSLKPGTTPNASGSPDSGYAVEARIPWSELGVRPPFAPGATLGVCIVNICRPELSLPQGQVISSVAAARQVTPLEPRLWQRVRMDWYGPLPIRGLIEPLPLWLGSSRQALRDFEASETDPAGPWWDRGRWSARLDRMRTQNMNTLVLRHTNPWTGLISPGEPQTQTRPALPAEDLIGSVGWFPADPFARVQEQFRWILAEASRHGISTYLLFDADDAGSWPAASTQPEAPNANHAASADVLAGYARQLLGLYPELAGLGAGAGFTAPPVLGALASGLQAAPAGDGTAQTRELLVWAQDVAPATIAELGKTGIRLQVVASLQGPHWYKPMTDASLQAFATRVEQATPRLPPGQVRHVALGGFGGALNYTFWGDPQWARALMLDVRNQGLDGFLLEATAHDHPLAREALFEYAYNAGQRFNQQRWESRLHLYGVGDYAGQLLQAVQHASAIVPESLLLLYDRSDRFMPQFGLLLAHYTSLPPAASAADQAGTEVTQSDLRNHLLPALGPAWSDPLWGRPVSSIRQDADRDSPPDAVAPWEIAARIGRHVDAVNSLLPALRHIQPPSPEQAAELTALLNAIELNVALGDHIANKIKAGIGWEQYKSRRGRIVDCAGPLQKSIEAWQRVVEMGDRLYAQPLTYWQSQVVSPPPWSTDFIRHNYVAVSGSWRDQLRRFERELNLIRAALSGPDPVDALPLWDHANAVAEEKRQTRFVFDFEKPDTRYRLSPGASIHEPQAKLAGSKSLLVDTRSMPAERHEVLVTDPGHVPLAAGQRYQIALLYRVIDPGSAAEPFEIGVRPAVQGPAIGDRPTWTAPAGHTGARILQVPAPQQDGNVFFVAVRAPAAILIDGIIISQVNE